MLERLKARWKLIRPLLLPLALYLILLSAGVYLVSENLLSPPWSYAAALAPMLPGVWIALGMARAMRQFDELERRVLQEALSISFALTMLVTLGLGFLDMAGLPAVSPIYIPLFMGTVWFAAKLIIHRKYE